MSRRLGRGMTVPAAPAPAPVDRASAGSDTPTLATPTQSSEPSFDAKRPETWPITLTLRQVAAIYQHTDEAVRKACSRHRFYPAPLKDHRPLRWRRADVLRDVEGAHGHAIRKAS